MATGRVVEVVLCDCLRAERDEHLVIFLGHGLSAQAGGGQLVIPEWDLGEPGPSDFITIGEHTFEVGSREFDFELRAVGVETPRLVMGRVVLHGGWSTKEPGDPHVPTIDLPETPRAS
jgi:hypothetical protein